MKQFSKRTRVVIYLFAIFVWLLLLGSFFVVEQKEKIVINLCKLDPENAELWKKMGVNLFDGPFPGAKYVGTIPACEDVEAVILEKAMYGKIEFWKIRAKGIEGWQTKRLLTFEE